MLNEGSTALPYEPYSSEVWHDIPHYIHNTATDTITTLPAVLYPTGITATVGLRGNTVQNGTPTPNNPVMPEGTGERTGNLFDMSFYEGKSGITVSGNKATGTCDRFFNVKLSIPPELYGQELTWSAYLKRPDNPNTVRLQTVDKGSYKYGNNIAGEGRSTVSFTATSTIRLYVNYANTGSDTIELSDITLNSGSTPLPYEPYGYKLDISSGGKNLFDYVSYFGSVFTPYNEYFNFSSIQLLPNTTYTLSTSIAEYGANPRNTPFIVATTNQTPTTVSGGISNISPITITTESDGTLKLYKRISGSGIMPTKDLFDDGDWLMLNTGSTPLPYEPYNRTTTPVYLSEVESTRRIKKLVLTGEESTWTASGEAADVYYVSLVGDEYKGTAITTVCTHFKSVRNATNYLHLHNGEMCLYNGATSSVHTAGFKYPNSSLADFKSYLATQYAAGTPVTVWYVLAEPETGIVNEPLMKIGEYADEVTNVSTPVTAGGDTLTVDTTVQPSEVTVNYKGWHPVANVHERINNTWT